MSLILDALKRADRERRLTQPPDLTTVYEDDPWTRRGTRSWFWLGGAFLMGAVAVGLILWSRAPRPDRVSAPIETSQPSVSATDINRKRGAPRSDDPGDAPAERLATAASPRAVPTTPEDPPDPATAARTSTSPIEPLPEEKPTPASAPVSTPDSPSSAPAKNLGATPAPSVQTDATPAEPAAPEMPAQEDVSVEPEAVTPPPPPPVEADPTQRPKQAAPAAVPLLSELPFEVREKLGTLQINVHSYSANPDERMVFINMKRLRTGDRIGEGGPVLKEITPEGAVIDYGDGQARLKVWR
jgi:general secretion pathway protein B